MANGTQRELTPKLKTRSPAVPKGSPRTIDNFFSSFAIQFKCKKSTTPNRSSDTNRDAVDLTRHSKSRQMGSAIIGLALSLRNYWDTWAERTLTRKKRQQCLKARSRDGWHCWRNAPKVNERFIPANSQILLNGVSSALKRYSLSAIETLKKPEIS
jgi:hypothetical protein